MYSPSKLDHDSPFRLLIPVVGLVLALAGPIPAQVFTTLYNLSDAAARDSDTNSDTYGSWTNSDGWIPRGLIVSSNTLYGTMWLGGPTGHGTVFALDTDGTGLKTLYTFCALQGCNDGSGAFGP